MRSSQLMGTLFIRYKIDVGCTILVQWELIALATCTELLFPGIKECYNNEDCLGAHKECYRNTTMAVGICVCEQGYKSAKTDMIKCLSISESTAKFFFCLFIRSIYRQVRCCFFACLPSCTIECRFVSGSTS